MTLRRHSRQVALQLLFQREFLAGVGGISPSAEFAPRGLEAEPPVLLHDFIFNFRIEQDVASYAGTLFLGVCQHIASIDALIEKHSQHWKISRMSLVDLSILRLAIFELRFGDEKIDRPVILDEAVELAKEFGSSESAAFVNGVLDPIANTSI
jgi:N utilization substance protein B